MCVRDPKLGLFDGFAADSFLFAIYSRARWSDLRSRRAFDVDVSLQDGSPCNFIGFSTFSHKTAAQVARYGLPLPLVAPIWGLDAPPWALAWQRIAKEAEIDFSDLYQGPVLPAPLKNGKWGARSVSSKEASKWLVAILNKLDGPVEGVSSHSLKCTTLSWLAKAGSNESHRLILGHHSSGRGSLEVYSRDLLAAPLRTLEDVLRQIRVGALQPDRTRSGILGAPTKADCGDEQIAEVGSEHSAEDSSSSRSSDSSSISDSDDDQSEKEEADPQHWSRLSADRRHEGKWDNKVMYQHEVSKVIHLEADSESRQFQCGILASQEHEIIEHALFLETRQCKRCQKAVGEI